MPWGDWQFWAVTGAAIAAMVATARVLIPRRTRAKRTALTISARTGDGERRGDRGR